MEKHNSDDKVFWILGLLDDRSPHVRGTFSTFAVLRNNTFGGITIREIFDPLGCFDRNTNSSDKQFCHGPCDCFAQL